MLRNIPIYLERYLTSHPLHVAAIGIVYDMPALVKSAFRSAPAVGVRSACTACTDGFEPSKVRLGDFDYMRFVNNRPQLKEAEERLPCETCKGDRHLSTPPIQLSTIPQELFLRIPSATLFRLCKYVDRVNAVQLTWAAVAAEW